MAAPNLGDTLGKLLLRLTVGALMLFHGISKIVNPAYLQYIDKQVAAAGLPHFVAWGVFVGEVVAPVMVAAGVFSRVGGVIIAVNMGFAIYLAHMEQVFTLSKTGGWALELQAFYLLCGLAVAFMGSGRAALRPD
jgi:putative oxidoreductase